jgi:hypothetical protein
LAVLAKELLLQFSRYFLTTIDSIISLML